MKFLPSVVQCMCRVPSASGESVHTSRKTVTWAESQQPWSVLTRRLGLLVKDTRARITVGGSTFDTAPGRLNRVGGREAFPRREYFGSAHLFINPPQVTSLYIYIAAKGAPSWNWTWCLRKW